MAVLVENNNIKNAGRKKGSGNTGFYKWEITMWDKDTNQFKEGKYCSIRELNEEMGLHLNSDYVKRIMFRYRADLNQRNKENSFLQRWGHIKLNKIHEKRLI